MAAIAVGIPARDEAESIGACIGAVAVAASRVDVPVVLVVVADGCVDDTAGRATRALAATPHLAGEVLRTARRGVGAARALALDTALRLSPSSPGRTWLASTDADTVVAPTWLEAHTRWAARGHDAIAGLVDVDWAGAEPSLRDRYTASLSSGGSGVGHRHVHGANLGLRGTWWRRVGGCGDTGCGEDHELWRRLEARGARTIGVDDLDVTTSGRLRSRVDGGFADYLAAL